MLNVKIHLHKRIARTYVVSVALLPEEHAPRGRRSVKDRSRSENEETLHASRNPTGGPWMER